MADDDAKGEKAPIFFEGVELVIVLIILGAVALRVARFFSANSFSKWVSFHPTVQPAIDAARVWLADTVISLTAFANGFSLLLVVLIGYILFRTREIQQARRKELYPEEAADEAAASGAGGAASNGESGSAVQAKEPLPNVPANLPTGDTVPASIEALIPVTAPLKTSSLTNGRWLKVMEHISSDNPSDWRLAILEADIVLIETLDRAGYVGDTLGDKLKAAERRPFATLNAAWEAHKVRNAIAHEGQSYELTQREARRVIDLFRSVIVEFDRR